MIISPVIIFIAWSNVLGQQYLLPTGENTEYTLSVVCGAIINFIVNLLLVRNFTSIGVSIGTIIAEFSVTSVQFF
nr:polysaccharide biosynthesis C-terminal domain-containing protein [Vagococcus elongatus]